MPRFRKMEIQQNITAVHASIHNHTSHQRHLTRREFFKRDREATLAESRNLAA